MKKVFDENNYNSSLSCDGIDIYKNSHNEFYLVKQYEEKELGQFFSTQRTIDVKETYDRISIDEEKLKKNATLIILVTVDNVQEFITRNSNSIYSIEEDEYFFRKHIIASTEQTQKEFEVDSNVTKKLDSILYEKGRLEKFRCDQSKDNLYFTVVQMFTKLPFLIIEDQEEQFVAIETKFNKVLRDKGWEDKYIESLEIFEKMQHMQRNNSIITNEILNENLPAEIQDLLKLFEGASTE